MNSIEKLEYIYSLEELTELNINQWAHLQSFAKDIDSEVRNSVAELLAIFPSEKSEAILLSMINDEDTLVRASVCDSLCISASYDTLKILMKYAKDNRYLVRGYAILSIADIQMKITCNKNNTIDFLKCLYKSEKSEWVKIFISRSLCLLDENFYINNLLEKLNSRYYKNRICVLNSLDELIDIKKDIDISELLQELNNYLLIEKVFILQNQFQTIINKIKLNYNK